MGGAERARGENKRQTDKSVLLIEAYFALQYKLWVFATLGREISEVLRLISPNYAAGSGKRERSETDSVPPRA